MGSRYVEKLPRNIVILENFAGVWSEEPEYLNFVILFLSKGDGRGGGYLDC